MIELLKKYKVAAFFVLLIILNISWYLINNSKEKELDFQPAKENSSLQTWQNENTDARQIQTQSAQNSTQNVPMLRETAAKETFLLGENTAVKMESSKPNEKVPIYICGAVANPGVYYVNTSAIIYDVLTMCGGAASDADESALNLAGTIIPNQKIYVPKIGEEIDKSLNSYENKEIASSRAKNSSMQQTNSSSQITQLININTATAEELQSLTGIGQVKAKAIIDYRTNVGAFKTIDEILNVSGIGDKTLEKIRAYITV